MLDHVGFGYADLNKTQFGVKLQAEVPIDIVHGDGRVEYTQDGGGNGGDGDGDSGGVCGDGVCGAGESCDGRNGTTACGDSGGVTDGKPSNRWCEVEGACEGPGC